MLHCIALLLLLFAAAGANVGTAQRAQRPPRVGRPSRGMQSTRGMNSTSSPPPTQASRPPPPPPPPPTLSASSADTPLPAAADMAPAGVDVAMGDAMLAPGPAAPVDESNMQGSSPVSTVAVVAPASTLPAGEALPEPPTATIAAPPPLIGPVADGDLRLVDRVDINGFATGALQVFHDGAYGAVCSNNFDDTDAHVACRQMGFIGGANLANALARSRQSLFNADTNDIKEIIAPYVLENLNCTGSETRLVDCPVATGNLDTPGDYRYEYDVSPFCEVLNGGRFAFVACGTLVGPAEGELRLSFGVTSESGNSQTGRLDFFSRGGWGRVCDSAQSNFEDAEVAVACGELGFEGGVKTEVTGPGGDTPLMRRIPFVLPGARCTGTEERLAECGPGGPDRSMDRCGPLTIATLTCFSNLDQGLEGSLRLSDGQSGPGFEYGRLEIFLRGLWSNICDRPAMSPDAAQVACRILGYDGGAVLQFAESVFLGPASQVLEPTRPLGLSAVDCEGNETSLLECSSSMDVGGRTRCSLSNTNLTDVPLLACADFADCPAPAPPVEGDIRLRGGSGSLCDPVYTGFVEIFHLNEWGGICNDCGFGSYDYSSTSDFLAADVVCRQLGFAHGNLVDPSNNPGSCVEAEEQLDRFWLSEPQCRGPEERLIDCDLGSGFLVGNSGCSQRSLLMTVACRTFPIPEALEDVTTPGAEEGDLRLVEQSTVANWLIGRPEVFFDGTWSAVCSGGFDEADANVACRQLGLGAGTVGLEDSGNDYAVDLTVLPPIALTSLGCTGMEARLVDCGVQTDSGLDIYSNYGDGCSTDFRLACVAEEQAGVDGAIRLTGTGEGEAEAGTGFLEIFHAGAWGTVCDGMPIFDRVSTNDYIAFDGLAPLTQTSADVACRQLGFAGGIFSNFEASASPATQQLPPPWLGSIQCTTLEDTIAECGLEYAGTATCGATQKLICRNGTDVPLLQTRLVGGGEDPAGAWAYGQIELFDGDVFTPLSEVTEGGSQVLGRGSVEVACRSLGFATGAQIVIGDSSALPADFEEDIAAETVGQIICRGDEDSLADCPTTGGEPRANFRFSGAVVGDSVIALVCTTPSGCVASEPAPQQGDVRLRQLEGATGLTQPCDVVHFGGVEIFNEGQWGRVCKNFEADSSIVTAKVVCRQLGFPFSSLMDVGALAFYEADYNYEYVRPEEQLVWATEVRCTGKEESLADCFFPEQFGNGPVAIPGTPVAAGQLPAPNAGRALCTRTDEQMLGVVCRNFEIEGSDVIRRL
eukprot:jgi/Ulvmu1/2844/UM144_0009.1